MSNTDKDRKEIGFCNVKIAKKGGKYAFSKN
jgi:hypothetical protein